MLHGWRAKRMGKLRRSEFGNAKSYHHLDKEEDARHFSKGDALGSRIRLENVKCKA